MRTLSSGTSIGPSISGYPGQSPAECRLFFSIHLPQCIIVAVLAAVNGSCQALIFGFTRVAVIACLSGSLMRLARCGEVAPIDIGHTDTLLSPAKKGGSHASVLYEVPRQERDQEPQEHRHEEQETGNPGRLPDLWHQGVQNRQVGLLSLSRTELRRAGYSHLGVSSPFVLS